MVICAANAVFIHVSELHLDPDCIKPLLMQNGAHSVAKAVSGSFTIVADTFDNHVDTGFTHRFVDVAAPWKHELILTGISAELQQDRQNLV